MHKQHVQHTRFYRQTGWSSLHILPLLVCLLVLSACNSLNDLHPTTTARSQPVIATALQQRGHAQLQTFHQWIALLQQFKGDASTYQRAYTSDQHALKNAKSAVTYQHALTALTGHVDDIKALALKTEAMSLQQQLSQEFTNWSANHTYHDDYNNTTYHLGYEYGPDGMGGIIADDLSSAKTLDDYQQAVEDASTALASFQAYQKNASDTTPWNQTHLTDLLLMQHYGFTNQKVIVVSLNEQTMRVYDGNQLIKVFHVTTGRPEKPSLPGSWLVQNKLSPTVFKSGEPVGSPYWYPDTPIHYALLYHEGGYFIHDSWWRSNYGPGTQFPHVDSSGDSFSFDGSHGCINLTENDASWVYQFAPMNTHVLVY